MLPHVCKEQVRWNIFIEAVWGGVMNPQHLLYHLLTYGYFTGCARDFKQHSLLLELQNLQVHEESLMTGAETHNYHRQSIIHLVIH